LTEDITIRKTIEDAIRKRLKIRLQMEHTPQNQFILFHPYALLSNSFDDQFIIGLVERHHINGLTSNIAKQKLSLITFAEALDVNFEPKHELWSSLDIGRINIILKA